MILKTTWEGFFHCDLSKGGTGVWTFADRGHWSVHARFEQSLERPAERLARQLRDGWSDMRASYASVVTFPELPSDGIVRWLAGDIDNGPPVEPLLSSVLRRCVSARSLNPIKVLTTLVDNHAMVEIQGKTAGSSAWFYLSADEQISWEKRIEEYALMFPTLIFYGSPSSLVPPAGSETKSHVVGILRSQRILQRLSVIHYNWDRKTHMLTIGLRAESDLAPYPKGLICSCIPLPGPTPSTRKGSARPPSSVTTPEIVVTDPGSDSPLKRASRVWEDRFARSVLVTGQPGSGKEAIAQSIPYGSGRSKERLRSISLASADTISMLGQIFGRARQDGSIYPGIVASAKGSAVFFDEAHAGSNDTRDSLLRMMESGEYLPVGSDEVYELGDTLLIFASSLAALVRDDQAVPDSAGPQDFWTRMTHVVQIEHPLASDQAEAKSTLAAFFKFFWWQFVEKYYGLEPELADIEPSWYQRSLEEQNDPTNLLPRLEVTALLERSSVNQMAKLFTRVLEEILEEKNQPPSSTTIRGVRSMVSRMFTLGRARILRGEQVWMIESYENEIRSAIRELYSITKLSPTDGASTESRTPGRA